MNSMCPNCDGAIVSKPKGYNKVYCSKRCKDLFNQRNSGKIARNARVAKYHKTKKGMAVALASSRRAYKKHHQKALARAAVGSAIKTGKLHRPNICSKCKSNCAPQAHHYKGYDKENYLKIKWLCKYCHTKEHHK